MFGLDELKRVYFCCPLLSSHNLGQNKLLGLTQCFIANRYCRFCKVHRSEAEALTADSSLFRNAENHKIYIFKYLTHAIYKSIFMCLNLKCH